MKQTYKNKELLTKTINDIPNWLVMSYNKENIDLLRQFLKKTVFYLTPYIVSCICLKENICHISIKVTEDIRSKHSLTFEVSPFDTDSITIKAV